MQRVDRPATAGQFVEPAQVPVGPSVDQRVLIPASQNLHNHGAMVGEVAVELRSGAVKAFKGIVIGPCRGEHETI